MTDHGNRGLRGLLVGVWRYITPQTWFLPFLLFYVQRRLRPLNGTSKSAKRIRLLVLNGERIPQDLDVLGQHPDVELISLPSDVQALINAIFLWRIRPLMLGDSWENVRLFHNPDHPAITAARKKSYAHLCRFLPALARRAGLHGMMSCSFYYRQDMEWQRAGAAVGLPFFALHKENMQDKAIQASSIEHYRSLNYRFLGDRIFLYNDLVKRVLVSSLVCTEEKMSVVGALRVDDLYRRVSEGEAALPKRQVVLFSSHHCIGLLRIPGLKGFFNHDRDAGFVEYFELVHGALARFAHDNPDVTVVIKPKWTNRWIAEIKTAIKHSAGLDADSIPNLTITADVPAQTLIQQSAVVVGINSTTLLEAKLFGRPVVMPLFAEAAGKYYDKHVYFKDYFDTFNVARSPEALIEAIEDELAGRAPRRSMPPEMMAEYLGFFDGKTRTRVVSLMQQDIEAARNRHD